MSLKELMRMLSEQNVKENYKPTFFDQNDHEWDLTRRMADRLVAGEPINDPAEELQPQHMVSPKENLWLALAKKGVK